MSALPLVLFVLGLLVLVVGAELLVRGASRLAVAAGVSPLVVGLTVVAFGTGSPELAVSVGASLGGRADLALGNVVGSNIFNVLFILGLSALITPLVVARQLVRLDVPLMIAVSVAVWLLALDGRVARLEGGLLFAALVLYTIWSIQQARRESAASAVAPVGRRGSPAVDVVTIVVALGLLVLGAGWLVDGAGSLARALGVSELVIGLTIVAAGTSLPEVATSLVAGIRGERDIAVGNVVGSNIFNLLGVLGLAAAVGPAGVRVSTAALGFDVPVMTAVAVGCLPIFFTGHRISRWEGALFLGYYVAYVLYLALAAKRHDLLGAFSGVMVAFVIPLTVVTLGVFVVRAMRRTAAHAVTAPPGGQ
jgi:cation:H+ antiporter